MTVKSGFAIASSERILEPVLPPDGKVAKNLKEFKV
jgi:hypothetical protein